jgi:hypothetical protein
MAGPAPRPQPSLLRGIALVALYLAITAWLSWPYAAQLGTRLPAVHDTTYFDSLYSAWALAYETHALTTAPATLPDANIYHPTSHALFYGPNAFGALPYFAPVFLLTGNPAAALNVMFLLAIAMTAGALHWVVWRWTGEELAGLVAAWTFLTTRWVLWEWLPTAPHAAVLVYFPLIVFLTVRPNLRLGEVLLLAALIAIQCLTEVTYVAPPLVGPLVLLALGRIVRRGTRVAGLQLLAAIGLAAVVLLPVLAQYLAIQRENPVLRTQTLWKLGERSLEIPWGPFNWFTPYTFAPLVVALIALGALARLFRRAEEPAPPPGVWMQAWYWALIGLVLSLTPIMVWHDQPVRLPHSWLAPWIPFYRYIRIPSRLGIVGLLGVALLAGLAFAECARLAARVRVPFLVPLLACVVLSAFYVQYARGFSWPFHRLALPTPYPLQVAISPDEPLLPTIQAGRGPFLEVPINRTDSGKPYLQAAAMYRSIFHWRPLVNGYSSYYPIHFPSHMALAEQLPNPVAVMLLRARTGLSGVLVHTALLRPQARTQWLDATENRPDLRLVAREGDDLLFEVTRPGAALGPN